MPKNLLDLRFGIRRRDGYVSSVWRVWVTHPGDVYVGTRSMAAIEKFSFHKSGICRSAFTSEHGTAMTMKDRTMFKWRRNETPPVGSGGASRVALVSFPTDYLSRPNKQDEGQIVWFDAAPSGGATYVEFAFTAEAESTVLEAFGTRRERSLVRFITLPTGEAFLIDYYHADWQNRDLRMPGNGRVADLLFSAEDTLNTGRPVRIRFGPPPTDGDAALIQELGGYAVTVSQADK